MPKVSKESAAHVDDHGVVEDRHEDVDGYTVNFVVVPRRTSTGRRCSRACPTTAASARTGATSLKGRLTYRFADHEEVFEAGDAFYLPARPHPARPRPAARSSSSAPPRS